MSYTDLTATFSNKRRLTYQDLRRMGENDADNHLPANTAWEFFQAAAPAGWVKQTTVNDKMCRVTSGAGGGTGGSLSPSTGLVLAHSHTVNAHTHSFPSHQHILDYLTEVVSWVNTSQFVVTSDANDQWMGLSSAGATTTRKFKNRTQTDGSGTSASASPGTDSQLGTLIPAYIDVIVCNKE